MGFIQLIEVVTKKPDEIEDLGRQWAEQTEGRRTARRSTLTEDREHPGTYLQFVEFDSYDEAMANSALPETGAFAERLSALCDAPPVFRNLDVRSIQEL